MSVNVRGDVRMYVRRKDACAMSSLFHLDTCTVQFWQLAENVEVEDLLVGGEGWAGTSSHLNNLQAHSMEGKKNKNVLI